jgi:hypothetical protein
MNTKINDKLETENEFMKLDKKLEMTVSGHIEPGKFEIPTHSKFKPIKSKLNELNDNKIKPTINVNEPIKL